MVFKNHSKVRHACPISTEQLSLFWFLTFGILEDESERLKEYPNDITVLQSTVEEILRTTAR
eukprot:1965326-Amphidinium_carterae.2